MVVIETVLRLGAVRLITEISNLFATASADLSENLQKSQESQDEQSNSS